MEPRYGLTVPFDPVPLAQHREWYEEAAELGYTDLWSAETQGADAFTPLALAAAWTPTLRLGTAIVPSFTRGPATIAQSVAAMASAAPGRFAFGLGCSSNVIVENWNGIPFEKPYQRNRDMIRFLRAALKGEKVTEEYETFSVRGFRLTVDLHEPPPILLAALRPGMLGLAGREADGAIVNLLAPADVPKVTAHVGEGKEIVARVFVLPGPDAEVALPQAKFALAGYLTVPVYRAFQEWLGRGPQLQETWDRWEAGDRAGAVAAIPDSVADDLFVTGSIDECRARLREYQTAGITTLALALYPLAGVDVRQAIRDLAPG